ncbi:MAG: ACP phosphodiesterase [Pseudomonadota bacterium]
MNFLAHCALANDAATIWQANNNQRQGLLAGAVVGDFVKGRIPEDWPAPLAAGVKVHRRIDAVSNTSPYMQSCSNRYSGELRRFAPIFVDLIADYHLCLDWGEYYPSVALPDFAQECYRAIGTYSGWLPARGQRFLGYMREEDLFTRFAQPPHLERSLGSVLRRLNREHLLAEVIDATDQIISECADDCRLLHQELAAQWQSFRV